MKYGVSSNAASPRDHHAFKTTAVLLASLQLACMDLDKYHATDAPRTEFVATSKSCGDLATTRCQGESCCTAISMPGGTYSMGRGQVSGDSDYFPQATVADMSETPEHDATVAAFALDKYEVTVGRFRSFVAAYDDWHVSAGNPSDNAGAHPIAINTGWGRSWRRDDGDLPSNSSALIAALHCSKDKANWTDAEGEGDESHPINCVNWYVAFAFCAWDSGRLPTEAEWEYAAAGGEMNRLYPWGDDKPDNTRANYWDTDNSPHLQVGSKTQGKGPFGHLDLAGSMSEWVFDWWAARFYGTDGDPKACSNCANDVPDSEPEAATWRVNRGGNWLTYSTYLRAASRGEGVDGATFSPRTGIRCARDSK